MKIIVINKSIKYYNNNINKITYKYCRCKNETLYIKIFKIINLLIYIFLTLLYNNKFR